MKILIIHEVLGALAGAEQNILLSGTALKERGNQLYMAYDRQSDKRVLEFDNIFTETYQISFSQDNRGAKESIRELISTLNPDIVYAHKLMSLPILSELVISGKPLVRMIHDHDTYCIRSYRYSPYSRKICTRKIGLYCLFPCLGCLKRDRSKSISVAYVSLLEKMKELEFSKKFDNIFVVTNYMKDEFLRQDFDPDKVHIFPPVPKANNEPFQSSFSDDNVILYVGQIIRGKGVDCLIKSLACVKTEFKAYIIGDGSHLEYCMKLAKKLGVDERIVFTGWVDQSQLHEYYKDATLVTVPSVWPEPIATIGLEVLRYGLPVVGFDSGGISDWLIDGQTGFLIDWMDITGFSLAIDKLLIDKSLARQLGEQGREFVNIEYDFEQYIDRMEKQFEVLCTEKNNCTQSIPSLKPSMYI